MLFNLICSKSCAREEHEHEMRPFSKSEVMYMSVCQNQSLSRVMMCVMQYDDNPPPMSLDGVLSDTMCDDMSYYLT